MKTPNTHSQDWKVVTYHEGSILDTRFFETIEEASHFCHDLTEILETTNLKHMFCRVLKHNPRPAEVLLDWL
jgi:hypothetical protein